MQPNPTPKEKLAFSIYPPIYNFLLLIGVLLLMLYILSLDFLFFKIFATVVLGVWWIEFLLLYILPLRVEIDRVKKTLKFRDFQFAPELLVKDDVKDEYATVKPLKHFSISNLTSISCTRKMPELRNTLMSLFPRRTIGCKYTLSFSNSEKIEIYVGLLDQARHRKAFKKIADFLQIPLLEEK